MTCYYAERESIVQIGYRKEAAILTRRGSRLMPESVSVPSRYGLTSADQYRGGASWTVSDMFAHVRTPGITSPRVI